MWQRNLSRRFFMLTAVILLFVLFFPPTYQTVLANYEEPDNISNHDQLPSLTSISDRAASFWDLYQQELIIAGVVIGLHLLLLFLLIQNRAKLAKVEATLETKVAQQTAELRQINQQLTDEIAKRDKVEKALRLSEHHYRHSIEASLDAFFMMESVRDEAGEIIDFRILEINDQAVQQLAMTREQLLGGLICELFPINRINGYFEQYKQVALTGEALKQEFYIPLGHAAPGWYQHQVVKVDDGVAIINRDITAHKQLAEDLRQQRDQLDQFFTASLDLMCIATVDGRFLRVNQEWEHILGYTIAELEGLPYLDLVHPDDHPLTSDALETLKTGVPIFNFVNRYRDTNDRYHFIEWRAHPQGDLLYASARDITPQREMEVALRASEERYRLLTDKAPLPTVVVSLEDGQILYLNEQCARLFNITIAEALHSHSAMDYFDPLQRDEVVKMIRDQGYLTDFEIQIQRKSGEVLWVSVTAYLSTYANQPATHAVFIDITARKKMELALKTSEANLEALRQIGLEMAAQLDLDSLLHLFASHAISLLEGTASGIQLYDPEQDGLVWVVNINIGLPDGYVTQRGEGLVGLVWEQQRPLLTNQYNTWENRLPNPNLDNFHAVVGAPIHWGREFIGVIAVGTESPTGFADNATDILSLLATQAAIAIRNARLFNEAEEARQAAESANQAKSTFLSHMSHELRTPLNSILGYTQLHQHDTNLTERQRASFNTISRSGEHLLLMINDILDLSKIEAGRMTLSPSECHLPSFLQVIVEMITVQAQEKGITFDYKFDNQLPTVVIVDEKRMRQILLNLLSNAVKFTLTGGVQFTVMRQPNSSAAPAMAKTTIRFTVQDSGIGMSPDQQAHIFDSFQQAHKSVVSTEGTGLGLAISQRLAHMMDGTIHVESNPLTGSRFWVELILPTLNTQLPFSASTPPVSDARLIGWRPKVLIVEDDPNARLLLVTWLKDIGFVVHQVTDGQAAVEEAVQWQPDLILIDLHLPKQDGATAVSQIKQQPHLQDTVIFAISASAFEQDRKRSLRVGCQEFIAKPINLADLWQRIFTYLPTIKWQAVETDKGQIADSSLAPIPLNLPPENAEKLRTAISHGDIRTLKAEIEALAQLGEAYQPTAECLTKLAQKFQLTQLRQLLS